MSVINQIFGDALVLFIVLAFIASVLLIEALYLTWRAYKGPEASRIERRLRALSAGGAEAQETSILKQQMVMQLPLLDRWVQQLPRAHSLERLVQQSGSTWSVGTLIALSAAVGVAAFLLCGFVPSMPWLFRLIVGGFACFAPLAYVSRKRKLRLRKIDEQLPDALDLISRALKAGHALPSALKMVAEEAQDPIASEFRLAHDEVNYGVAMPAALANLAVRVPSTDVRYFIVALLIQRETGGNLTELLHNISSLVRARLKLFGKIRVLSAEGRMSAWILGLLPFVLAAIINAINPKFMSVLWTDPAGLKMIYAALIMMFFGVLMMRKIINIRV